MRCMRARNVGPRSTYSRVASGGFRLGSAAAIGLCVGDPVREVSGLWNENVGRERGEVSSPFVNGVSAPVDSYANGSGRRQAGSASGRPTLLYRRRRACSLRIRGPS